MTLLVWAGVAALGGLGALLRFHLEAVVQSRSSSEFPFGTLAVNLLGSFLLGLLTGLGVTGDTLLLAGTGLLGSFTTFSTWMLETERATEDGESRVALANLVVPIATGLGAAAAGWAIGALL
jgi:fluoride exporter